ncbi:DUF4145 domain-containing protein [Clostridium paraputrificum]|uniref:DUF4145 domain-containing protein n=1 Tax=Clostridium paraputrificum TaxID=29363 RepID=UPI00232B238F|nr:DUF4145 domain-containing protein [Clostridium paraputrificum]MDB2074287.1 DUF4145 domain-containing protein [Clostridium paraputrificum]MDB2077860.1 DUF4145 domain-containing protein [Clostridium paraputrificum]
MSKYVAPSLDVNSFTCPYCNTLALQQKDSTSAFFIDNYEVFSFSGLHHTDAESINITVTTCKSCLKYHVWINGEMLIPSVSNIPLPLDDMPDDIKQLYNEARDVFPHSKRAAAALLRLVLQKLCVHLGEKGKNINDDIARLVSKGLPVEVQKALDYVRVTGNNSVHPGEMDIDDNDEICLRLFSMVNFIVDRMIIQPKEIAIAFDFLPKNTKIAIEKRDKK